MYPEGSLGFDLSGRHIQLLDAFAAKQLGAVEGRLDAQESMSVSDFGTYLGTILRNIFTGTWAEVQGAYAQYTHAMDLPDFEEYSSYRWGRFPDWSQRALGADVDELAIKEYPGPKQKLIEWAAAFSVTRRLILADRSNRISQLPAALAEAGSRTKSKRAVAQLIANPTMFDGNAFISAAHNNIGTTALTADIAGVDIIKAILDSFRAQTDDEGYKIDLGGGQYVLVVPPALRWIANALASAPLVPVDVTSGTSVLRANEVAGTFSVVVEPYLTDANNYYMFLNPNGPQGAIAALNLNGNTSPAMFQRDSGKLGILGTGSDPYTWVFDKLEYFGRDDYDFVPFEFRTVFGGIVA